MIKRWLTYKIFIIAIILYLPLFQLAAANRYSVANGNWSATSTWSATSGGASGASVPGAGDNVLIEGGYTVTTDVASACTNLSIANGSKLNIGAFNFTANGTTTVNGIIAFTSTTGTKLFIGLVSVNASGFWNNNTVNASITHRGGITTTGTFNAGTGTYTFDTNNQALTGTFSLPNVTVTGITLTNNGNLTVGTALGGTGGLTQNVNSTLNLGGTSGITTLTAANNGNTVNFSGAAQNVNISSYYNLTISGSGNKTLSGSASVNGTLSLTAGTLTVGANTLTLNGPTIAGTPSNLITSASSNLVYGGTTASVLIPASVVALSGLSITNTSIVTLQSSLTVSGTFNPTGAGLSIGANTLTLNGIINCGTLVGGPTSNIIIGNAGAASLPGVILNNLTINRAVTMCGNVIVGGTLNLTSGALSIAANTLTLSNAGFLTYGAGSLTGGVTSNMTIGTGANTTLNAVAGGLNNFSSSRNIVLGADLSINGTLTLTAGTFTAGARTLTLNGPTIAGTPSNLITSASSSLVLGGTSAGVIIPASIANLNNLTINNANGVTMNSNITLAVGGVLTLTRGIVQAGTYILKITNTNPGTALAWTSGSFINVTSGSVERTLTSNLIGTGNNYLFPIGDGGVFKGINLLDVNTGATGPVLRAGVSPTGALTGDGTTIGAVDPRCWSLLNLNSGNLISAKIELYETGLTFLKTIGISSAIAGIYTRIGGSSNSSSIITPTVLNPGPYFCIGAVIQNIYYSYQTGSWNTPNTWTSDPSGTLQTGSSVPGDNDKVIILTGRTVSLPSNITSQYLDITINSGGFLDQNIYSFTNSIYALRGQGTIKLASINFPISVINTFINSGGGTSEYYNGANFTLPVAQSTYNNLTINSSGFIGTQLGNITINGNLNIKSGTFRINDNTSAAKLTLIISGNLTVDNGAFITVGNGVTNTAIGGAGGSAPFLTYFLNFHTVIIKGDFTNNGTVSFTNLPYPIYNAFPPTVAGATSGAASVYFQGSGNNSLNLNGITNFYNLIIDKGIDQTYKLTINSTNYSNFKLFGANILATDGAVSNNPNLRKALWIRNGTLVLKGSLIIPSLSEGIAANSDYYIPSNGAMILDGVDVVVLSSADDYREINVAYTVAAPNNATIGVTMGGFSAMDIFGKLQINNGYLSTRESGGLITSNIASGQLFINGGTVDAKQFLASTGSASYTQTGGLFILRGRFQRTPVAYSTITDLINISTSTLNTSRAINGISSGFGSFNLEQPTNIFSMSGGTIQIYDVCGIAGAEQKAFDVKSSTSNINVTGGIVEIRPTTGTALVDAGNYYINTSSPLMNLLINRASSSSVVQLNTSPLVVLKNLTISSGGFSANNLNVTVGGDFSIANGTSYTTGTNTTILNGTGNQTFTVNLATPLSLNKLTIDKPSGIALNFAGSQSIINIADNFRLNAGILNDNGNSINIAGNVFNSGIHSGTGKIVMNGILAQSIDGNGIFGNVELNNTNAASAPVSLVANMTLNGQLTFSQDKLFNINTYNFKLNSTASIANSGSLRYIKSAGNAGDGGLTKVFSSPVAFIFPVGVVDYTPGSLGFSTDPTTYGSITLIPVNYAHPNVTAPGRSLTYFWRVKSSGFTLGSATVTHGYRYAQANVVTGGGITEDGYVAARFNVSTSTWTKGTSLDVDEINNIIGEPGSGNFLENVTFIDGDYTAGDDNPVNPFGTPAIYYSRINGAGAGSGLWSDVNTWSTDAVLQHTGAPAASVPGVSDIVIIGAKDSVYLATNNTVPNTDVRNCASLKIEKGSALDIGYNFNSNFGMVLNSAGGNGNFRMTTSWTDGSTYTFPAGDFSDFNVNLGTTELYSTNPTAGTTYWLPNGVFSYGNLILSPLGGSNIIFPNNDLTIFGNLVTRGQNADSWFCPSWNTAYPTAPTTVVAKTITINGNLDIQGGALIWYGNGAIAQNIVVNGNVIISPLSAIDDGGSANNQSLSIGGALINNANGSANPPAGTVAQCRFTNITVTFFGPTSTSITNTTGAPSTTFGQVIINKGTSHATTLTCNIGGTLNTLTDNWLTLQNGTFQFMRTDPATDFTISTTTPFTIPSTSALIVDYANANNRNILIGNAGNNAGDLLLSGKLALIRGNVYIGPIGAPSNNNDIEYSGSGASAIDIRGGNLVVNGQIRRNTTTTNGILNYTQSGGNVTINGNATNIAYAKLEVLNEGSRFDMSGGTLSIIRGGGSTYGDLYLRPATSSVTGGTIIFTNIVPGTLQNYLMDANIPLNNLIVTGPAGAGLNANVGLIVSPLVLNGTLTLSNAQSILNSNNITISIKGNLDNSGTYNFGTNTTIFNGGAQLITGSSLTNFYSLNVLSANSLTIQKNFFVNNDLFIESGTLILGNKKLFLSGNLVNSGSYTDDNTTGGISLSGTTQQQISGTGAYGKLEINNSSGAILNNGIMLQNDLVLTQGIFNINSYPLTLSQNSSISGVTGITAMIMSDGVTSSTGVRKYFTAAPQSFTFPVGVAGKYTPALFSITANGSVGYINVNPIDNYHPSVLDPSLVLNYYWKIESSGISGFTGNVLLQYISGDVNGVESDYVAARLVLPGNSWSKALPGPSTDNVDETNNRIAFFYSGINNLNGDYTAGNDSAFPDEVPTYRTNKDGNWSDESIWTPVGSIIPCPVGGPNGANVIIDHIVTTNINNIFVLSTTINNRLRVVSPTFGHNLGNVDGSGTIYLESGNLPGGNYSSFVDCIGNGTIEYGGTGIYTLIAAQFSNLPNIFFTGTGSRVLPEKNLTICKRLVIDGPVLDNSVNNSKLTIMGSMERYNTGSFLSGVGAAPAATVAFAGSAIQSLGGPTGDFSGANKFNNLEISNFAGLNIGANGSVEINDELLLTNGIINTTSSNRLTLLNTSATSVTPAGGNNTSFINGPLIKQIINGDNFLYPLGKGTTKGHNFILTSTSGNTLYWTVEYLTPNTTATSLTPPLAATNTMEFWSVKTTTGATARVKLGWDPMSDLTPLMTVNGITDMRVAEYNASSWGELSSITSGDDYNGDVATSNNVTISTTPKNYTIASITPTIARASLSPVGPVCGSSGIPVSFTSFNPITLNYSLIYTINGTLQPTINVTSLPFILPTPIPGTYQLTDFTYNNGASIGAVDGTIVNVYANPPVSNAGSDQSLCGVSGTVLTANSPAPYSGLWTIISGSGGTFINSSLNMTVFTGVLGVAYTLRWTISNVTCTSSDDVVISFPVVANRPSNFISAATIVCMGSSGNVYTVPNVSGVTYNWSFSGTGSTINGTGNSVTVDYNASATSGILSVTATNSCGTSAARTISVTVNAPPVAIFSYTGTPYCPNAANPSPTFSGGGIAGTFSSTSGLVFISSATGQINIASSTPGSYTVTNTIAASGGCGVVTATSPFTITSNLVWNGAVSTDWNVTGNWLCGCVPLVNTSVQIPNTARKPVLSSGAIGTVNNLVIDNTSSLTVSGNTLQITGTITNNGTLTATSGTITMNGSAAQVIGTNIFNGNTIKDLIINNPAGVTLQGPLNITGIVTAQNGDLSSGGNLTLVSTAGQTALVNGNGAGNITGNVTMQRYLPSGFGFKYFSSPFQAATVNEFADDITLGSFTFYKYDESRTSSGWVSYNNPTTNVLFPLQGYTVNFGSVSAPVTLDVTGAINNGNLSVNLYNHDNTYTKGFNLVGNPYPSPIDWNAAVGWTKTNIDNALYYFKASTTDQYGGTYSTYINGISSDGVVNNIIPSMQGFFIHVTNGSFPVTGILALNNGVRISDLTHPFTKSLNNVSIPLLRLTTIFSDDTASADPVVMYFDEKATTGFDSQLDALKLLNTDLSVANLYAVNPDGEQLSIKALPPVSEVLEVPLGLKLNRDGTIIFRIRDIDESLTGMRIFLSDIVTGIDQDLLPDKEYKLSLGSGEYDNRFSLNFSNITTGIVDNTLHNDLFSIYSSHGKLNAEINIVEGDKGNLKIYNFMGQVLFTESIYEKGYHEFNPGLLEGIYFVRYITGSRMDTKKIFIQNQ